MTTRAQHDYEAIVDALREVLSAEPADAGFPGRLRLRLDATLGSDESHRLRRLVHQVVSASEDNLPVDLTRIAPLTTESLQRLTDELADHRGWSHEVARRTTQIWATALGFEELVASSWPRDTDTPAEAPFSAVGPLAPTVLPDPVQSRTPDAPDREPAATTALTWPATSKRLAGLARGLTDGGWAATQAYSGLPLLLVVGLGTGLTVALCVPIIWLGAAGGMLGVLGFALASLLVRQLGYGILVAGPAGLTFTPYDGALRKERPDRLVEVSWDDVSVREGLVSRLDLGGRRVQVGPRNRGFARAAASHAGRGG